MMRCLFSAAERYLKRCTVLDIALLKICLCALGVLIGLAVPVRRKRAAAWTAAAVFAASYVPLTARFLTAALSRPELCAADEDLTKDIPRAVP